MNGRGLASSSTSTSRNSLGSRAAPDGASAAAPITTDESEVLDAWRLLCVSSGWVAGDRGLKAGEVGLSSAVLLGRLSARELRARGAGYRVLDRRLPVGHESALGEFGLGGGLRVELVLLFGGEDADRVALVFGSLKGLSKNENGFRRPLASQLRQTV